MEKWLNSFTAAEGPPDPPVVLWFCLQSEEVSSPPPAPAPAAAPQPPAPAAAAPALASTPVATPGTSSSVQTPPSPVASQYSLTQEQLIRQQLLAKQKQLLELQQKKIELELEQTKAQLVGHMVSTRTHALKRKSANSRV